MMPFYTSLLIFCAMKLLQQLESCLRLILVCARAYNELIYLRQYFAKQHSGAHARPAVSAWPPLLMVYMIDNSCDFCVKRDQQSALQAAIPYTKENNITDLKRLTISWSASPRSFPMTRTQFNCTTSSTKVTVSTSTHTSKFYSDR